MPDSSKNQNSPTPVVAEVIPATVQTANDTNPKQTFVPANQSQNQAPFDGGYIDPILSNFQETDPAYATELPQNSQAGKMAPWKIGLIILGIVLVLGLIFVSIYAMVQRQNVPVVIQRQVAIAYSGPETVAIGSIKEWTVEIKNNNNVPMYNTRVVMSNDPGFQFQRNTSNLSYDPASTTYFLEQLEPGTSKVIKFEGILTAAVGTKVAQQATVLYNSATISGKTPEQFTILSDKFLSTVANPEVKIEATRIKDIVEKGGEAQVQLTVENISDQDILNLQAKATYPLDSFTYFSSTLDTGSGNVQTTPSQADNVWNINRLEKRTKQTIIIKGKVKPEAKAEMEFSFTVSAQTNAQVLQPIATTSVRVTAIDQSIAVSTFIENKINNPIIAAGDDLQIVIRYENKGSKSLNDVQIVSSINDPADIIDYSTIKFNTGNGTINGKTIAWRGAGLPELVSVPANGSGSIKYSVKVKSATTFLNSNLTQDKYTLQPAAEVSATDRQPVSVTSETKYQVGGILGFTQNVEIIDDVATTSFVNDKFDLPKDFKVARITWSFSTTQNRIKSITLDGGTPLIGNSQNSDILSINSIKPTNLSDKLTYNAKTGAIKLALDTIDPYLGFARPKYEVVFEIKVKPDSNTKSYKNLTILRPTQVRGVDDFTGKEYAFTTEGYVTKSN